MDSMRIAAFDRPPYRSGATLILGFGFRFEAGEPRFTPGE